MVGSLIHNVWDALTASRFSGGPGVTHIVFWTVAIRSIVRLSRPYHKILNFQSLFKVLYGNVQYYVCLVSDPQRRVLDRVPLSVPHSSTDILPHQ